MSYFEQVSEENTGIEKKARVVDRYIIQEIFARTGALEHQGVVFHWLYCSFRVDCLSYFGWI